MNRKAHINFITEAGIWTRIYSLPRYKKYTASNIESISGTAISLRIRKYTFSGFNEYLVSEVLRQNAIEQIMCPTNFSQINP